MSKLQKGKNKLKKLIKRICIIGGVIFVFILVVALANSDDSESETLDREWAKAEYYTKVKRETEIEALNSDGNMNGINLLLISRLSEGFIKEYLTLAQKNQEGMLNPYSKHMAVENVISLNIAESYTYPNTPLPVTYLPFENGEVVWNKSVGGLPAEALTLSKANRNVIGGKLGVGPVAPYYRADLIAGDPANGGTATPFQIGLNWFYDINKPSMNGYNADSSRNPDPIYFPDQLAYLDRIITEVAANYMDLESMDQLEYSNLGTLFFADGEGNVCRMAFNGIGSNVDEASKAKRNESWQEYKKSIEAVDAKYGKELADMAVTIGYPESYGLTICIAAVECGGWMFENDGTLGKLRSQGLEAYQRLHPNATQDEWLSFLNSHIGTSGGYYIDDRRTTCHIYLKGEKYLRTSDPISLRHIYTGMFVGKYYYAYMLQMGGLTDVDPSKPSTFMNGYTNNGGTPEWVTGATTDILAQYGIDASKLSTKRLKLLNEGISILGTPYVWGGTKWPTQNADGSYNVSTGQLDCSGFTQQCTLRALGIDISRTTYTQIESDKLERIDASQAQPGDILFNDTVRHVLFFISGDPNGVPICMHAPQSGDVVTIRAYHSVPYVYRIKGIDDP